MTRYRPVDGRVDFPAMDRRVLELWRRERVFERSVSQREADPEWSFYDGPPTANGRPGIHHVEARTFKDLYPRYKTMTGHLVRRRAGWDCHGLPVEIEVEKEIGTRSKRDIEAFGVAEFVERCRESVARFVDEFRRLTERMGYWVDMDGAYWTMDSSYVESVWWALKALHAKDRLYQGFRTVAYCPRCGTGLSDHEVAQGYARVTDPSVYVAFPVVNGLPPGWGGPAALVAWTTTPWTLPSNLGLAVAPDEEYVLGRLPGETRSLIVARRALEEIGSFPVSLQPQGPAVNGSFLTGVRYEPPYPNVDGDTHRVVAADFVSMDEGTGIVHIAPGFGADDLALGRREGWPPYRPVDDEGRFTADAPEFVRGRPVKEADSDVIDDLRDRGLLVAAGEYEHTYPHCWRCKTPLLYMARPSWYIRTTALREELLAANEATNWFPDHIKRGRYGEWLRNNVDWALSRERYWGTPLPVWVCPDGHRRVVGSLAELSELAGRDVTGIDPHRPVIDGVAFPCPDCGGPARRVPEVIDVWFDSGAMPYAQWGYSGEGSTAAGDFRRSYPADFICEAIDQTRGWFYSLMAEGVLLFGESAYRNVVCLGWLLDQEGRGMSKSLGNTMDPAAMLERHGADAVRWYMVASGSPWSDRRVFDEAIQDLSRRFLLTLWNTYAFAVTYANIDEPDLADAPPPAARPPLDRWVLSRLAGLVRRVREAMDGFDATAAAHDIEAFIDELSNWYVRLSRRRFWDPAGTTPAPEKLAAHATLHECLTTVAALMAPIAPFVSEEIYRNLVVGVDPSAPASIHLTDFPVPAPGVSDAGLERAMETVREAVSLGRTVRTDAKIRIRQPLAEAVVHVPVADREGVGGLSGLILGELNVREVRLAESAEGLAGWRAKPDFRVLGPRLGARVREVAAALEADDGSLAAELAAGRGVRLDLAAGPLVLEPGDVRLEQHSPTGWAVASDGTVTVALDLELTEELRLEGVARELVHHVQALRRDTGLAVTDRIDLGVASDAATVVAAIDEFGASIAADVLASTIAREEVGGAEGEADVVVDGHPVRLTLKRT